jgi:RNA polymerase sigma-70 factor (ECF subfamily)
LEGFEYRHWLTVASRWSRRKADAPDLLHDALLDAVRAARTNFAVESNRRWFSGVIRNRAALAARTAARRTKREQRYTPAGRADEGRVNVDADFLRALAPAARSVAVLVVAGLNRAEIIAALGLSETAFRQRLTSIRRMWRGRPTLALPAPHGAERVELDLGLIRRALLRHVVSLGGIGTHDPDGHLIVLHPAPSKTPSHLPTPRQRMHGRRNRARTEN